jgi:superfamily II DNA/RNA helicase
VSTDDMTTYPHTPDSLDGTDDLDRLVAADEVEDDELADDDDLDEGDEPGEGYPVDDFEDDEDDLDDLDDEDEVDGDDDLDPAGEDDDGSRPAHEPVQPPTFAELGVRADIVASLERVGILRAFPIQSMTLPVALTGHDIIGQAKTGTGKTLGFGIPLLQRVAGPGEDGWGDLAVPGKPQALVVVPTRELAVQVAGDLDTASKGSSARVLTVYGGRAYEPQIEALRRGVEVVAGTPGRLLDLAQQGHLDLGHCRVVVLDEADEMLDLGFLPDVERLLAMTPAGRQTMLFSATMPGPVVALARRFMTQPTHIRAADPDDTGATVKATAQYVYRAHALDKVELLSRILQARGRGLTIVFARTKRTAAKVAEDLEERGFAAAAIHGDLGQGAREQALRAFRNGKIDVLVATDVAARGIDVDDVTHVINYQCPEDEKTYLHRIGRTARAGNTGTAVTFVDWDEVMRWSMIDKALDLGIPEAAETYSSSPHLYTDLDIPTGIKGRLPASARTRAGLDAEVLEDLGETGRGRRGDAGRRAPGGRPRRGDGDGRSRRDGEGRSRGDGPRGDASRGGRRPASEGESQGPEELEAARPRRDRQRRRTRAGRPLEAGEEGSGDSGAQSATSAAASTDGPSTGGGQAPARNGRRTRSAAVPVADGPQALFLPPSTDEGPGSAGEAGAGPADERAEGAGRRRRRRGGRGRSGAARTDPAPAEAG